MKDDVQNRKRGMCDMWKVIGGRGSLSDVTIEMVSYNTRPIRPKDIRSHRNGNCEGVEKACIRVKRLKLACCVNDCSQWFERVYLASFNQGLSSNCSPSSVGWPTFTIAYRLPRSITIESKVSIELFSVGPRQIAPG